MGGFLLTPSNQGWQKGISFRVTPIEKKINAQKRCCVYSKCGVRKDSLYWCSNLTIKRDCALTKQALFRRLPFKIRLLTCMKFLKSFWFLYLSAYFSKKKKKIYTKKLAREIKKRTKFFEKLSNHMYKSLNRHESYD